MSPGLIVSLILLVVLAVLFWKAFLPDFVVFSNDGPLSVQESAWSRLPHAFLGQWYDLNTLGIGAGAAFVDVSSLIRWFLGPVGYSKFLIPITLWLLGAGAYFFFRRSGMSAVTAILGGLAACLTTAFFSDGSWGAGPHVIAFAMDFFALGALAKRGERSFWLAPALGGMAVGINVIEASDIGALFSLVIAAFVMYQSLVDEASPFASRLARGVGRTVLVAAFAGFIAANAVFLLVGANITGVAGTKQDEASKAEHWDFATQWSLPKGETLSLIMPGVFGYRMDTPGGGNYWGAMGRDQAWYRYFASDRKGPPPSPQQFVRYTGRAFYIGITVVLIGLWAAFQSLCGKDSVFTVLERKLIWFWVALGIVSLLLAWGRFAPFYRMIYSLPYFSTIRSPEKFLHILTFSSVILFGFGVQGLMRRYVDVPVTSAPGKGGWWAKVSVFDRRWIVGSVIAVGLSLVGWLIYVKSRPALEHYIASVDFSDAAAEQIAGFSIRQAGVFVLLLAILSGLLILIFSGAFAGRRSTWVGILLGVVLVGDLASADMRLIVFWNYKQKYEVGNLEPIVKFLADKAYERRVAYLLPQPLPTPDECESFHGLYGIEWTQQLFPFYNIPTLDIVQMPRMPEDLEAFNEALRIGLKQDAQGHVMLDDRTFYRLPRLWELSATRYLVGPAIFPVGNGAMAPMVDLLNTQFDPELRRFRIVQRFELGPRPGVEGQPRQYSEVEAVPTDNPQARYALFEFTGALPRAVMFSNWEVKTNNQAALDELASPSFDPSKTVLLPKPLPASAKLADTNQAPGSVTFQSYQPENIKLEASSTSPSVLMLCDKYDPSWEVWVDGKRSEVLVCDYLMRGVYLEPGRHEIQFKFQSNSKMLYFNLAAILIGICLLGYTWATNRN